MKLKAALLIFFATFIVYSNSLGGEFAWDDDYFIGRNSGIKTLDNMASFFTDPARAAFGGLAKDIYRPLTALSYALNYRLSGLNTFGYHLVNVLLHSLNAVLLFLFLYYLFNGIFIALFVSLLFAVHPIQTEVVSWISGRSSVLFLCFYLSSLIFYVKGFYLPSIAAFALGLFSKEMAVTLPLVLVLYDIHFKEREKWKKLIMRYLPYFFLMGLFLLTRSILLKRLSQTGWWWDNPYYTFLTMSKVMAGYVKLLIAPVKLCVYYFVRPTTSIADAGAALSVAALVLALGSVPFIYRRSKALSFAILWFFVTILPVSNIVPLKALMAERFLYLPAIGLFLFFVIIMRKIDKRAVAVSVIVSLLVVACSARTMARNEDWKDAVTISASILKTDPLNPWGLASLGTAQMEKGEYGKALVTLKKAVAISPDYSSPRNALGFLYLKMDKNEDAVRELKIGVKLDPDNAETLNSLGIAHANLKQYGDAEACFREAFGKYPAFASARFNLGTVYETRHEYDKALLEYRNVFSTTKNRPELVVAHIRIGDVQKKMGKSAEAEESYRKAIEMSGDDLTEARKLAEERLSGKK